MSAGKPNPYAAGKYSFCVIYEPFEPDGSIRMVKRNSISTTGKINPDSSINQDDAFIK
jgi:hypothetical protein